MGKSKRRMPKMAENLKARGAGLAATTHGRKTTFTDRKRKANKMACRKWKDNE